MESGQEGIVKTEEKSPLSPDKCDKIKTNKKGKKKTSFGPDS
jgi:hypothetical protein